MAEERIIKTVNGIFLGNITDPLELNANWPDSYLNKGENEFDSRARFMKWLNTKTVGPPVATPEHEEMDMRKLGLIGVYFNEENGDTVVSAEEVNARFPGGLTDVEYLSKSIWITYQSRHRRKRSD